MFSYTFFNANLRHKSIGLDCKVITQSGEQIPVYI